LLSGGGDVLAGEAASDAIHDSTPRAAVEGGNVIPDRSLIQDRIFHPRHEIGRCIGFPLNVSHNAGTWEGDFDPEVESADS